MRGGAQAADRAIPCDYCGARHTVSERLERLRRIFARCDDGIAFTDLVEAWSHIYGGTRGERMLYRDLALIGAVRLAGEWHLQREARP